MRRERASERLETMRASERFGGRASGGRTGGVSWDAPGSARGGEASGSPAAARRPRQELPSAAEPEPRRVRAVREQKRSIFRHKQHFKKLHTQIHTPETYNHKHAHSSARTHTFTPLAQTSRVKSNTQKRSLFPHRPPPSTTLLFSFSQKTRHYPAKDCQNI